MPSTHPTSLIAVLKSRLLLRRPLFGLLLWMQVSMLITPLLVYFGGHEVRYVEWLACGLGLLGSGEDLACILLSCTICIKACLHSYTHTKHT
jgi:hypothetical protein